MKKHVVIAEIAQCTEQNIRHCITLYDSLIHIITVTLKNQGYVDIPDLGIFSTRFKNETEMEAQEISDTEMRRVVPIFTPSRKLVSSLNNEVISYRRLRSNTTREDSTSFDANLNQQSKLGAIGYSLQLSRDERWTILVKKAIPKYGIASVQRHISWLVRLKKKDRHRDYSSAVFEWEYDLRRLDLYANM